MEVLGYALVGVAAGLLGAALALCWARARGRRSGSRTTPHAPPVAGDPARTAMGTIGEPGDRGRRRPGEADIVLSTLRSAVVLLDHDDHVVDTNPAADRLVLVRGDRLVHDPLLALAAQVRRSGRIHDVELDLPRRRPASALAVRVRAAPLGEHRVLLLVEDHTEARQLDSVRRDFVVNVSHELKTPVGALALLAETIEDAAEDPPAVRRFAGRMQVESQRLSALVQEIIELSRVQVSGSLAEPAPVRVDDVVQDAVDRARTAATAKGIEIDVGGGRGAMVRGDRATLVTAVHNLLDNAIAYSAAGTRIALGVQVDAGPGGHGQDTSGTVQIAVVDQGIGIGAGEQSRLFERFYRVDPARSRDTGGTGLGLSIVKHVVAEHGGEVTVWSQPGRGSTFTVHLPVLDAAEGAPE